MLNSFASDSATARRASSSKSNKDFRKERNWTKDHSLKNRRSIYLGYLRFDFTVPLLRIYSEKVFLQVVQNWISWHNEPFSTAERSERVENFLFRATREYTEAGIEQRRLGANSPEPRRRAVPGWHVGAQKTSSYITARPWLPGLIVGPCPSEESLCCPACPPAHPFFADSRPPVSKVACLISLYLLSTCMYHTFSHITFLGCNHMNSRASVLLNSLLSEHIIRYHMCPWGRLLPGYHARFFFQRGCCCQDKEVVPVDHIRGKGLSSRRTSGSKIRLTAGFEPCPQGPAPSSFIIINYYYILFIQ